ncbi:hypothetical protein TNCV_186011 [Trichonephila clavipes]|nr:hypothetical protein TNCV_186011 [Trichonephila clavipes]
MAPGEDQISSFSTRIRNLTLLTSSKYNELNEQVMLSKWIKTTPLKKKLQCSTKRHMRKRRQNLKWIDGLEKDLLVLRIKNWRTLAGRRLAYRNSFLRRPRPTLGCRATEEGRKEGFEILKKNSIRSSVL